MERIKELEQQLQATQQQCDRLTAMLQEAQAAVAKQAATYRHLFDDNPQPMWVYDLETLQFLAVNEAAIAKYGYSRSEFLAMTIADMRPPEDVPRLLDNIAQVDSGLDFAGIWQHRLRDGQLIQVEITSYALAFEGRQAELVMAQDVTQLVAAQQALQALNRSLEQTVAERTAALHQSQAELHAVLNNSPLKIYVEDLAGRYRFVNPAFLTFLHRPLEDVLGKTPFDLFPAHIAAQFRANEQSLIAPGGVQQFEEAVLIDGEERTLLSHKFLLRDAQGEAYGLCGMSVDITDRKAMEAALQGSRDRLQAVITALPDLVFRMTREGRYLDFYPSALTPNIGSRDDLTGHLMTDVLPTEIAQAHGLRIERALRTQALCVDEQRIELAGAVRYEEVRVTPCGEDEVVFVIRDISDRKRADLALQESQQLLQTILDTAPVGIFWKDCDGVYQGLNAATVKILNLPEASALVGHTDAALPWDADALAQIQAQDRHVLATATPYVDRLQTIRRNDGTQVWLETSKVPLTDAAGNVIGLLGTTQDISQRRQAELNLQASQRFIESIAHAMPGLLYVYDVPAQRSIYTNREVGDLIGYTPAAIQAMGADFIPQVMHPDDLPAFGAHLQRLQQAQWGDVLVFEYRMRHANGEWRWFISRDAIFQRDEQGQLQQIIGTAQDITDSKAAAGQLVHLSERLSLALEAGQLGIWSWDLDQRLDWDAALCRMYGLPETQQWTSWQDWRHQIHRDDIERVESRLQATLEGAPYTGVEFRIWRTDGELRWIQSFAQVQRDAQGRPAQLVGLNRDITHRKQAELEKLAYAERVEELYNTAPCGYCSLDAEDRITSINDTALQWLDYPREAVLGQPLTQFLTVTSQATFQAQKALLTGQLKYLEYEITLLGSDGGQLAVLISEQVEKDEAGNILGSRITLLDIRQRLKAERLLQQQFAQEKQLREVTQHMRQSLALPEILAVVTQQVKHMFGGDRVIVFRLFGDGRSRIEAEAVSPDFPALQGQAWADEVWSQEILEVYWQGQPRIVPDVMADRWTDCLQDYSREGQIQSKIVAPIVTELFYGTIHRWVNPQQAHKLWGVLVIHACQEQRQWQPSEAQRLQQVADQLAIAIQQAHLFEQLQQELGDRQRAEQQLAQRNQQLSVSNQQLERATRLKDEFLANMSHELRTPLNAILGMTEGLQEEVFGPITERQQRSLATIERSGSHLLSLINDILDLSKIEAGQLELDFAALDVAVLCQSSLTFVKQQAHKKQLQLNTQISPHLPTLYGDDRRLHQVLINLLTNAVKFTPAGGQVTLSATYAPYPSDHPAPNRDCVHPQAEPAATVGVLSLAVTDTGIGISAENAPKLFQPFVQVESALNRQHDGTGLGLALVKRATEMHGGQVELRSEVGRGSCFTVRLPILASAAIAAAPPPPGSGSGCRCGRSGRCEFRFPRG